MEKQNDRTAWFARCGWGVFCHYLGSVELSAEDWNKRVDAMDVAGLAAQLKSVGAPYFCLTIGQNSGHYLAPNATYDRLVGINPSKCSRRDLISDLYDALHPLGIELMVYLPSGAPAEDTIAMERLGWEWGFDGSWSAGPHLVRTGKRLVEFQQCWEAVIREWSLRWGSKVRGWWIDGCYFADEMYRSPEPPNFHSFAAALRAGNPDSIAAFNPGVLLPVICHSEAEDFTAGEIADALPECPGAWVSRGEHQARYHILSYLGSSWCQGDAPRFPDDLVVSYTQYILSKGGVITWDVPILPNGLIPTPFLDQLRKLSPKI